MIAPEQEKNILEQIIRPSVRIVTSKAMGSGTIIYSKPTGKDGKYDTYVLTNHHVIEANIKYEDKVWDDMLEKDIKKRFTSPVEVNIGRYTDKGLFLAAGQCQADIVTFTKEQDIALIKLKDTVNYPVANLYPHDEAREVPLFNTLVCCGAALGEFPPTVTEGRLNAIQKEIDNFEYWMSSAQSVFGNSGGAVYTAIENDWYFLGIPSRISVVPIGFGGSVITHVGYFIPAFRVYNWITDVCCQFLFDSSYTIEQCEKLKEDKKEKELAMYMRKQG